MHVLHKKLVTRRSGSGAHGLNQLQQNGLKKSLQYSHKYFSMAIEPAFATAGKVKALAENSVVRHFPQGNPLNFLSNSAESS